MTQPTPYTPSYSFTDFSSGSPTSQPPGSRLDAEFSAIQSTLATLLANVAIIQRDDTRVANDSIGVDQLDDTALALIASPGFVVKGAWLTATSYILGDLVSSAGEVLLCTAAHTSGVLATDVAAGRFTLVFDPDNASLQAALALSTGAALIGSTGGITVQAALNLKASLAQLASVGGAALVGTAAGITVEAALALKATYVALAAAGGSANIGFQQSGSGAVAGTLQAEARRTVWVQQFGPTAGGGLVDDTSIFQLAHDALPSGGIIKVPAGTYLLSKVTITNRNITFELDSAATLKKYGSAGAGGDSIGERGIFIIKNLLTSGFILRGGKSDLNGEGHTGIGTAGRIPNTYAPQTLGTIDCINGPANAVVFGLRATHIVVEDHTVSNTAESALLFRNCSDVDVRRVRGSNIANFGVEFSFVASGADGGSGTMPDRSRLHVDDCDFEDVDDRGLGSGNAACVGGGGAGSLGVFTDIRVSRLTGRRVYRGIHFEFQAGSYIDGFQFTDFNISEIGQNGMGGIGLRNGKIQGLLHNVGEAPAAALTWQKAATYPDVCGVVLSSDFVNVSVEVKVTDDRLGGVVYRGDGVAVATSTAFNSAGAAFASTDVGKRIGILGAGPSGVAHVTTIASRISATQITLTTAPQTSVAVAKFAYGGACREGIILYAGTSADVENSWVEAGIASGLASEPLAAAIRIQTISDYVRIANTTMKASTNGGTRPCGLRMIDAFAGRYIADPANRNTGFTDAEVGTYTYRASVIPATQSYIEDRTLAPSATINTYGTEEILYPDMPFFSELLHGSVQALGTFGAETVTFRVTLNFFDSGASAVPADITFTAVGTTQLTSKHMRTLNPDGARIKSIGMKMKSSIAGSLVTGKVNATARQL